ncbi:hypothetical protein ACFQMN_13310 [Halobacillus campisalis]|uniref:Uncharacterized protein n=2 Tax=Halobacillus campisalis TaxID=435909 RepID=A0ABW2K6R9_9BACI|nr:hypothetical protein [Halobacillus campisalis]
MKKLGINLPDGVIRREFLSLWMELDKSSQITVITQVGTEIQSLIDQVEKSVTAFSLIDETEINDRNS